MKGRQSPRKGKTISENQRIAIIESNHRRKGWKMSEEAKKRISEGCKGRSHTIESKAKLSKAFHNRKHITNGKENKFIKIENLNNYLSKGWRLGQTNNLKKEGDLR